MENTRNLIKIAEYLRNWMKIREKYAENLKNLIEISKKFEYLLGNVGKYNFCLFIHEVLNEKIHHKFTEMLIFSGGEGEGGYFTPSKTPLSMNTYGGTEIPVFRRCVAGMIERAVQIISIICQHSPIAAACDYKLDRIQSNFVKMKQEPQVYNITSDKLEFVRNTLKIMIRFFQENFDDFRRKILTIFL